MISSVVVAATILIVGYTFVMYLMGREPVTDDGPVGDVDGAGDSDRDRELMFVALVPCLNEELVIGRTIDRLLSQESAHRFAVLVIDDGSTDGTAEVVESYDSDRVWLHRRALPDARQGKGEALNSAYRFLRAKVLELGVSPDDVVIGVLDADGRLEPGAIDIIAPHFADPRRASVQIGVRIHNAPDHVVARLQDMEFATYTELFQRGRSALGSAGLGGNGQFVRLSALMSLGDAPWTDCLTEDLDLGIRLLVAGWSNRFCHDTWVSQQGLVKVRPLVRQRSRWFQGHLQCLGLIPMILRSRMRPWPKADLVFHLVNPLLMLALQTASIVWMARFGWEIATQPWATTVTQLGGLDGVVLYLLAFCLAPVVTYVYLTVEPGVSGLAAVGLAHLYIVYGYMWYVAGLRAVGRQIRGRRGWAKTARVTGTGDAPVAAAASFEVLRRLPASARYVARVAEPPVLVRPRPTPAADRVIDLVTLEGASIGSLSELAAPSTSLDDDARRLVRR